MLSVGNCTQETCAPEQRVDPGDLNHLFAKFCTLNKYDLGCSTSRISSLLSDSLLCPTSESDREWVLAQLFPPSSFLSTVAMEN